MKTQPLRPPIRPAIPKDPPLEIPADKTAIEIPVNGNGHVPISAEAISGDEDISVIPRKTKGQWIGWPDWHKLSWEDFLASLSVEQWNAVYVYVYITEPQYWKTTKSTDGTRNVYRVGGSLEIPTTPIDREWLRSGWLEPPLTKDSKVTFKLEIKPRRIPNFHFYRSQEETFTAELKPATEWRSVPKSIQPAIEQMRAEQAAAAPANANAEVLAMLKDQLDYLRERVDETRESGSELEQQAALRGLNMMEAGYKKAIEAANTPQKGGGRLESIMEQLLLNQLTRNPMVEYMQMRKTMRDLKEDDEEPGRSETLTGDNPLVAFVPVIQTTIQQGFSALQQYLNVRALELQAGRRPAAPAPMQRLGPAAPQPAAVPPAPPRRPGDGIVDMSDLKPDPKPGPIAVPSAPSTAALDGATVVRLAIARAIDKGQTGQVCAQLADAIDPDEAEAIADMLDRDGKLVAAGKPPAEIMADPILGRFVTNPQIGKICSDYMAYFDDPGDDPHPSGTQEAS
jgi:hypothetical protein